MIDIEGKKHYKLYHLQNGPEIVLSFGKHYYKQNYNQNRGKKNL
jgi:hypothetical protein